MIFDEIHNAAELMELIQEIGFLPLLDSGIHGFSAEALVDEDCQYVTFPDGGWDWKLWKWKGPIIAEGNVVYGKFFNKKAGFISLDWWPDFCNFRRAENPLPEEFSVEDIILQTLEEQRHLITRELRAACGFTGPKMRSKFDSYLTRLEMGTYIVTEDFVYPQDRHGNEYGWGWSLLTTPERLYGRSSCKCNRLPEQSYDRMLTQLKKVLPFATEKELHRLLK